MLHEAQTGLMAAVLAGSTTEALSVAPKLREGKLTAAQRIAVYRRNVQSALRGALGDIFPTTKLVLGDETFLRLADQFIQQEPSTSGDLNQFGRTFPTFLDAIQVSQPLPASNGVAADMAALDWAWHRAFHAAEAASLDLSRLGALPAEQHAALVFQLHPSAFLVESRHRLIDIWQSHQIEQYSSVETSNGMENTMPDIEADNNHFLIVHRGDADVTLTPLSAAQYCFLANCAEDQPLGEAAEAAFAIDSSFALQDFLIQAVHQNMIVGFTEPLPEPLTQHR